jgi:hypothetical protein
MNIFQVMIAIAMCVYVIGKPLWSALAAVW